MLTRLLRLVTGLCFPGSLPFDEVSFPSDHSSDLIECDPDWPEDMPITRLSVVAQAGSRRTSMRSWVSNFAREPRRDANTRQGGTAPTRNMSRRKAPPKATASMLGPPTVREEPRTGALPRLSELWIPPEPCVQEDLPTTGTDRSELGSATSLSSSASPREIKSLEPGRLIIRGIIRDGESGTVYLVRDTLQERDAAMKIVRSSDSLATELRLLRKLSRDPHGFLLAPYTGASWHEWRSASGNITILTEYYAGGTLEAYLGALSHREVWLVMAELVLGLSWLHAHQYIHHVLSPGNVFVGGDGHCAITGLDMCRRVGRGHTLKNDGSLDFVLVMLAPELQVQRTTEYDEKVDVWSLGVTVGELLTGELFGMAGDGASTVASFERMSSIALARMQRNERACGYLISLTSDMLEVEPIRKSLSDISLDPGFRHMGIRWEDVLGKREQAIRNIRPFKPTGRFADVNIHPLRSYSE